MSFGNRAPIGTDWFFSQSSPRGIISDVLKTVAMIYVAAQFEISCCCRCASVPSCPSCPYCVLVVCWPYCSNYQMVRAAKRKYDLTGKAFCLTMHDIWVKLTHHPVWNRRLDSEALMTTCLYNCTSHSSCYSGM